MTKTLSLLVFTVSIMLITGCTDEENSNKALRSAGYTDIQLQGYDYFGCSDDDHYHTKFTATNPRGEKVSGVVCCGIVKNCTIRF